MSLSAPQPLTAATFLADGTNILAGTRSGALYAYDLRKPNAPKATHLLGPQNEINYIARQNVVQAKKKGAAKAGDRSANKRIVTPRAGSSRAPTSLSAAKLVDSATKSLVKAPRPKPGSSKAAVRAAKTRPVDKKAPAAGAGTSGSKKTSALPKKQSPPAAAAVVGAPTPAQASSSKFASKGSASTGRANQKAAGATAPESTPKSTESVKSSLGSLLDADDASVGKQLSFASPDVLLDHMDEDKEEIRDDIRQLHLDMLRQFQLQKDELAAQLKGVMEAMSSLTAENKALREENARLKALY